MSFLIVTELVGTLFHSNYARVCEKEKEDKSRGITFQRKIQRHYRRKVDSADDATDIDARVNKPQRIQLFKQRE